MSVGQVVSSFARKVSWVAAATPLAVAACCVLVGLNFAWVSPLLLALCIGAVTSNVAPANSGQRTTTGPAKIMLRLGIVVLGLRVSLSAFVDIGFAGLAVVAATVTATFLGTRRLGRLLRVDADLVDLVAAGFAICGAAAVAAMAESTRPRDRSVAVAVALVTVFGSIAMLIVPWAAGALDLSARQSGIWAGASIHEIAQVVVAAAIIGPTALATATTVKLARVVLLAPVIALHATRVTTDTRNGLSSLRVPWFVAGFLLAALGRSTGLVPGSILTLASTLATTLLAAGMFGLGLGLQGRDLRGLSLRVLLLGAGSTGIVILVPLVSLLVVSGRG